MSGLCNCGGECDSCQALLDEIFCSGCWHEHGDHDPANDRICGQTGCPCYLCPNCEETQDGPAVMIDGHRWCPGCGEDEQANRLFDAEQARLAKMAS